ncbi:MAG: zf-HC2 domain-containing protein [Acidobacteriota bacterium]
MMHEHCCADVRERLEAFHDGELGIDQRIDIQNHLGECVTCNLASIELESIGSTLREFAGRVADEPLEPLRISAHVLERLGVEEQFSIRSQVMEWFQDMHLVWAGLGASLATMICVVGSASVLHAANQEFPNSMARVISVLASPGSNDNPLRLNYEMNAPRAVTDAAIEMSEEDVEYALSAVVSREGRVQGVEVINQPPSNRPAVNAMLNEAYRMQFAPATDRGDAVAVSVVWLVASTTVKGRHDEDMQLLRQALRLRTTPAPIAPLPIPVEATGDPKPEAAAPLAKPGAPEASSALAAAAAVGGV